MSEDAIYAVGRDVTTEREAQETLRLTEEALRQSQKLEAMGQLTGGVAHDFNNLLMPIIGSLDMLQRRQIGGEREQRLIGGALQSADRAKTLVQRLLAFARRQPLQPVAVDVAELVTGMAQLIESTTGPQIRVVVDVAKNVPLANADPNQLEMAILNLSVNARDAMTQGGTLRISASPETVQAIHRSKLKPGPYVRISVADTGTGMDEAVLARAIEPFFSTKGVGKGTGLGLVDGAWPRDPAWRIAVDIQQTGPGNECRVVAAGQRQDDERQPCSLQIPMRPMGRPAPRYWSMTTIWSA